MLGNRRSMDIHAGGPGAPSSGTNITLTGSEVLTIFSKFQDPFGLDAAPGSPESSEYVAWYNAFLLQQFASALRSVFYCTKYTIHSIGHGLFEVRQGTRTLSAGYRQEILLLIETLLEHFRELASASTRTRLDLNPRTPDHIVDELEKANLLQCGNPVRRSIEIVALNKLSNRIYQKAMDILDGKLVVTPGSKPPVQKVASARDQDFIADLAELRTYVRWPNTLYGQSVVGAPDS